MDSFQEVERLLPRNTSFHTVSRTTQWMNPKGAPTQAMLLDARRAVWDDIANGLQEHIDKAMTVHGFLPYHTEKAIGDLIVDIRKQMDLNPVSDVAQVIVQGGSRQHQMHELIDYLRGESAQRRASVQKNNTGHLPHPDYELTFDELNDAYEAVLGQMDDQFVRDMGRVIRLEVENLGDDWIDPVKIRDAVTDTIDNGGGTFHAKTMDPYSPAEHGGLAVGLYDPPPGAPTGFKVVDRTDVTAIKAAIDETVEAFPTADYVGTWVDPANPTKVYINPTKVFPRAARQEAMALARMHRQKTLFDYDLMNTVETPRAYNMDRAPAWSRKNGTPRKHTQNARDFTRKHNAARKASEHDFPKADKDIIDHPDTDLYMDPSGQAGLAVAPDGELTHVFSVEDASPHARTYIDELISEAQIDGKVGHAITEAAENTTQTSHLIRSGFVPVARAEGKVYWVSANKVSDVGRLADDIVDLADASQAFDYMFAIMDGGPPSKSRLNYRAAEGEHWPPGVQYLYDEDSFYQFHADLDPSFADEIGLLTPEQQAAIRRIEFDLRRQQKHGFTLRKAPQDVQGASYFEGQGDLIDELFGAERMLEDRMFAKPFIAAKQVWDRMFNPVFSREMMDQQGQFLLDELVQQGFSAGEVNAFVAELNSTWKAMPTLPGGTHMFRQPGAMTPNTIRRASDVWRKSRCPARC
jgi:hypothetical protein